MGASPGTNTVYWFRMRIMITTDIGVAVCDKGRTRVKVSPPQTKRVGATPQRPFPGLSGLLLFFPLLLRVHFLVSGALLLFICLLLSIRILVSSVLLLLPRPLLHLGLDFANKFRLQKHKVS